MAVAGKRAKVVAAGEFEPVRHDASGTATVLRLEGGRRMLTLTDFDVANGPDLRLYLVAGPARTGPRSTISSTSASSRATSATSSTGSDSVDLKRDTTVVVWCRAFSVLFARASLQRT